LGGERAAAHPCAETFRRLAGRGTTGWRKQLVSTDKHHLNAWEMGEDTVGGRGWDSLMDGRVGRLLLRKNKGLRKR